LFLQNNKNRRLLLETRHGMKGSGGRVSNRCSNCRNMNKARNAEVVSSKLPEDV
jgi:hypothetical protein